MAASALSEAFTAGRKDTSAPVVPLPRRSRSRYARSASAAADTTALKTKKRLSAAAAAVRNAALALHRTELISPVSGVIAKRSVQVGQRVAAGTPLLAVVPLENVWVDANFKEVQLERMRAGIARDEERG